ncbi:NADH-ubiquinone oxidoreductase-F iron-sulfur binding region domain-containing protein [Kibdelosporangium aridum]|uniref:NADH:ubiquinone oxidoreductase, NADH-binding subunit (Chain F) n=1 Tax=Kibdelosporangium aridum TaxID=2030 RepID=A0A1W2APS8_KIBAR|nr:NADH-ubiquinone oxidoreductase-F iron-sulfur binding region domain-containing protein [Kibdelosporangium aridum]SMC62716.1 NADH:ubiquinone oxidoreductase, NADH-binding subunit (chain F) [Kibdelosporangium aridum]
MSAPAQRYDGRPRLLSNQARSITEHAKAVGALPTSVVPQLIDMITASGLRGRGGGWFPSGRKIASVAGRANPYVVVNGMESEPAAGKDKLLLRLAPHLVLDGAELAALALGADRITVAVHRDTGLARHMMNAIADRVAAGWGKVEIDVSEPPNWYVSSESTAVASFVGGGEAKPKADSARVSGVNGRPTLVSNVETFAHIALIGRYGPNWFRQAGTGDSPGTALFTVSGAVRSPGVYELPVGITGETILRVANGVREPISAMLVGGYGGAWIPPTQLHRPFSPEGLEPLGASLGAGIVVALPARTCGLFETVRVATWMADQTAKQCGPCFRGLPAIAEDFAMIARDGSRKAYERLRFRLGVINGRGACAHPDGVVKFVDSALKTFALDIRRHLSGQLCPGGPRVLPIPELPSESEGWQ